MARTRSIHPHAARMLARLAYRIATEISPRLAWKAGRLWVYGGAQAIAAWKRRVRRGELFPPFLLISLTSACNLRCHGCWITPGNRAQSLNPEEVDAVIVGAKRHHCRFFILLGGEPLVYPHLWDIPARHSDCYFQVITNGTFLTDEAADRVRALGNVSPLVSLDGWEEQNDQRRGRGVFAAAMEGIERLRKRKVLFGVATTVTAGNLAEVAHDDYVRQLVRCGAMYLWYYIYRPVGADPSPQLALDARQLIEFRARLLDLRRRHPIVLIDTYWDAEGRAVCPAALGMGYQIGPTGGVEPCPPLSFACETIRDHGADLYRSINGSRYLRSFQEFVKARTRGCVILERPAELAEFLRGFSARDTSGRDALTELASSPSRPSHHLPGAEMPEDFWIYRMLKRQMFFGMGAYG